LADKICDRPRREKVSFTGMVLKPMLTTLTQFVRCSLRGRPNTILYPRERQVLPPRYRGKHLLSFTKCIGCGQCVDICPNDCMWMKKIVDPELGKIERPGVDYARCLFCGFCVEICPTDALIMTSEYELSSYDREGMAFEPESLRKDDIVVHEPKQSIKVPAVDFDKCTGKEQCAKVCPVQCIRMVDVDKTGKRMPVIDLTICTQCGKCAEVCPEKAIEMREKLVVMFERPLPVLELEKCTGCGACFRACPSQVIYMAEMPGTEKTLAGGKKGKPKKRAVFALEKCVGCSRCANACRFDALSMVPESKLTSAGKGDAGKKGAGKK